MIPRSLPCSRRSCGDVILKGRHSPNRFSSELQKLAGAPVLALVHGVSGGLSTGRYYSPNQLSSNQASPGFCQIHGTDAKSGRLSPCGRTALQAIIHLRISGSTVHPRLPALPVERDSSRISAFWQFPLKQDLRGTPCTQPRVQPISTSP